MARVAHFRSEQIVHVKGVGHRAGCIGDCWVARCMRKRCWMDSTINAQREGRIDQAVVPGRIYISGYGYGNPNVYVSNDAG
ncbi:MAG: hypothetical protein KDI51_14285, partial [Xanthomonadales bacterium]|nr:hypothetical protein [Xanthomonadales bacterium]